MRIGPLRHRLTIEQLSGDVDESGNLDQTKWVVYRQAVLCRLQDRSGQESTRGDQVDATATHEITTRYDSKVTAAMRGTIEGMPGTFNFVSVIDPDGLQWQIRIMARSQG